MQAEAQYLSLVLCKHPRESNPLLDAARFARSLPDRYKDAAGTFDDGTGTGIVAVSVFPGCHAPARGGVPYPAPGSIDE